MKKAAKELVRIASSLTADERPQKGDTIWLSRNNYPDEYTQVYRAVRKDGNWWIVEDEEGKKIFVQRRDDFDRNGRVSWATW